ncbi:MAG: tRNA uridine-5-carboxymethylaminomethyl(34) synthesis GTPase MnmE [Sphingopyxis sp.]
MDTIFALSSGSPPAAIAVIRISGPQAGGALRALAGKLPPPREAKLATLRDPATLGILDRALTLWFPGPGSATGEDLAEIHAHGGRAVVRAIESALSGIAGLRPALPGEFTRRALMNSRIDLAEAEGLADLLEAETEGQRRQALALAGGALSGKVAEWQEQLLMLSARVEAMLDFADESDVTADETEISLINNVIDEISTSWRHWLARPWSERLRDGLTVAIAGPPNAGKSTLLNAIATREAAIVSAQAGTTRDVIEVALALDGIPFRFADTAGLHGGTGDAIEAEGMRRAQAWIASADMLLWLGSPDDVPDHPHACRIAAQVDHMAIASGADLALSAQTGEGMAELHRWLVDRARTLLPREGEVAMNERHRAALQAAVDALDDQAAQPDPLLLAEHLRAARTAIDAITGQAGTEDMLDALFGRFCIGK